MDPQNLHACPTLLNAYILTSLKSVSKFSAACKSGKINPEMTREEADKLVARNTVNPYSAMTKWWSTVAVKKAIQNLEKTIDHYQG